MKKTNFIRRPIDGILCRSDSQGSDRKSTLQQERDEGCRSDRRHKLHHHRSEWHL